LLPEIQGKAKIKYEFLYFTVYSQGSNQLEGNLSKPNEAPTHHKNSQLTTPSQTPKPPYPKHPP
jgi:hypothetical protein